MENIREINTGKANIALVKLPEGIIAWSTRYHMDGKKRSLCVASQTEDYELCLLSEGKWEALNLLPDLTKEQYAQLVEPEVRILSWAENTDMPEVEDVSCKEVFNDIMIANNCFTVNPYGKEEPKDIPDLGAFTQMMRQKHQLWKKAEANTGSWLVLIGEQ